MNIVFTRLQQFRDNEDGVISIELLLVVPILFWALMSTLVYFDVYRAESISTRAALTVADMYSREETPITPAFLNGTRGVLRLLSGTEGSADFRVTTFKYVFATDSYEVVWSRNRGYGKNLKDVDLAKLVARIPAMANDDRAILLETKTEYDPPFSISLGPFSAADLSEVEFKTFTIIRPRYSDGDYCFKTNGGNVICD